MKLFDLAGRTALVTGSSSGIGLAIARGLAEAGARVVLNGRDAGRLGRAAEVLRAAGAEVGTVVCDVTDAAAVEAAVEALEAGGTAVEILVNNAGMQQRGPLESFEPAAFDLLMRTNVNAAFYVARVVARHMIARGRGRIINIASVQSALARPGIAPYTASKAAIAGLTRAMATEWARHGLNCNAIAPGYFDTPLNAALVADPAFCAWLEARTPAGRWGRVEELAGAAIFLASDAASFVNGHVLYVDGGITASL
jgi:gluconate 5-dehydrogenase